MQNILLVDGNEVIHQVVQSAFAEWPYAQLECTKFGGDAALLLRSRKYRLAIVDVSLPDISGYRIAALATANGCPSMLISGHPHSFDVCEKFDWPHLKKPFSISRLLTMAEDIMAQSEQNMEQIRRSAAEMEASRAALEEAVAESRRLLERIKARDKPIASKP